ncbi:MAG: hypothetical protein V8Q27_01630 [Eubacteriales bacterium]
MAVIHDGRKSGRKMSGTACLRASGPSQLTFVIGVLYATDLHWEALIATAVVLFVFYLIINSNLSLLIRGGNGSN